MLHEDGVLFSPRNNPRGWKAPCQQACHSVLMKSCLITASLIRRHDIQVVISLPFPPFYVPLMLQKEPRMKHRTRQKLGKVFAW